MSDTITGYVHYAKYMKDGKEEYFEHIDVGYDYEEEMRLINSKTNRENLMFYLETDELLEFGLKEVKIPIKNTIEGKVEENDGQTAEDFAVLLNGKEEQSIDIRDWFQRLYMDQDVRITVEFVDKKIENRDEKNE